MKNIALACCLAAAASAGLAAQKSETETKTKITVKDGKDVTVTGCVAPNLTGTGFILTNVADKKGALHNYMLLADDDLSKHVGHRVQIEGKATDLGDDAKVKVESKTRSTNDRGDEKKSESKAEYKGNEVALPYLGVDEIKMIAAVCP